MWMKAGAASGAVCSVLLEGRKGEETRDAKELG